MKGFDLLPTEENLMTTLSKDLLKRNKDILNFYNLLLEIESPASIAIDGNWGSGKTFFVKQTMMLINSKNCNSNIETEKREKIIKSFNNEDINGDNCQNSYVSIYYDAWENDNDDEPILSLIYEIIKQIDGDYSIEKDSNVFKLGASILEFVSGKDITKVIDSFRGNNPLKFIEKYRNIKENIKNFFGELLEEKGNTLVVFVDELDRCNPSYSVKFLERIKHYFNDERIIFVFSVNLNELKNTIKNYYGESFDGYRYLDRFFDIRISLPPVDMLGYYRELSLKDGVAINEVCKSVINFYNMELREISRFYKQVRIATHKFTKGVNVNWDNEERFLLIYIVPIMIGLKLIDISLYNSFINGDNSKPIKDVIDENNLGYIFYGDLLNYDETIDEDNKTKTLVRLEDKLEELYNAVFVKKYINYDCITKVGSYRFNKDSKKFLIKIVSLISDYSDYNI